MIRSMSGHGRGEASSDQFRVVAEVRTVNNRFCRISLRVPSEMAFFEEPARRLIQSRVQRGKVDFTATIEGPGGPGQRVNAEVASAWIAELRDLATETGIAPPVLSDILSIPGVLGEPTRKIDPAEDAGIVEAALEHALDGLDAMRLREGEHMAADLVARLAADRIGLVQIEEASAQLPAKVRDALRDRIRELLDDVGRPVDEERLIQEAAYYAERADVTEELVRIRSHLDKADALLGSDQPVGRSLEFLSQELHRELSTIGAKTKDLQVSEVAIELKSELEKIREQVQNIE